MGYRVEVSSRADSQLAELDPIIGASIERKILWLAENASVIVHRRLVGMPDDLAGLCKLRVSDWRISTGSIIQNKLFVFIVSNIAPKFTESFDPWIQIRSPGRFNRGSRRLTRITKQRATSLEHGTRGA